MVTEKTAAYVATLPEWAQDAFRCACETYERTYSDDRGTEELQLAAEILYVFHKRARHGDEDV